MFKEISNKKVFHDFSIIDEYDAGLVLEGWEVKALMKNGINFTGSYVHNVNGELFLVNSNITPVITTTGNGFVHVDQTRFRKLLLNKKEVNKIIGLATVDRMTIMPLKLFRFKGKFKLKIAVCKGKKEYDKRESDKSRTIDNDLRRTVSSQKFSEE